MSGFFRSPAFRVGALREPVTFHSPAQMDDVDRRLARRYLTEGRGYTVVQRDQLEMVRLLEYPNLRFNGALFRKGQS